MLDQSTDCVECDSPNGLPMNVTYTDQTTETLALCHGCTTKYEEGAFVRDIVPLDDTEFGE